MDRGNHLVVRRVEGSMKYLLLMACLLLTFPLLAGCAGTSGTSTAAFSATSSSAEEPSVPTALTCPSGKQVSTAGGFLAEVPDGADTRELAVRNWLEFTKWAPADADFIMTEDDKSAWVLRPDGTALARVGFIGRPGFTVYDFDACSD